MKTQTSDTPSLEAGQYIQEKLASHKDEYILLLVAGGSALAVLEAIDGTKLTSKVTIATTDDRFTHEAKGNNFAQLQQTNFYKDAREVGVQCISSKPQMSDTHESFTKRITLAFEDYFKIHSNSYTIGLFGIGEDGHTASIFPTSESEFISKY
jgi:6-phosphogluconolactonase/glucosamine-6-phosphate isomerase/deaminase